MRIITDAARIVSRCTRAGTVIEANNLTWGGISIVGDMQSGFPVPKVPQLAGAGSIIVTAVFIMFIGFVESIAVAKTYSTLFK